MNYLAHGRFFVGEPYRLAGTAVPDWLNVSDRGVRVRSKHALPFVDDADPRVAQLASGIVRHHTDDAWFHENATFAELCWQFTVRIRDAVGPDDGLRPSFVGHVLVEMLLDAALADQNPGLLDDYYAALAAVDGLTVLAAVNRMAPRPAVRLGQLVGLFVESRFLYDYAEDAKLVYRLNQVLARVRLPPLPASVEAILPEARQLVYQRSGTLLESHCIEPHCVEPNRAADAQL